MHAQAGVGAEGDKEGTGKEMKTQSTSAYYPRATEKTAGGVAETISGG